MRLFFAPSTDLAETFLGAMREYEEHDGFPDADGLSLRALETNLENYVTDRRDGAAPRPGVEPAVGGSELWWCEVDENGGRTYLGRATIRRYLNASTYDQGGQLWVSIRPSRRRQGLGTELLAAALPFAAAQGVEVATVTCQIEDQAARKIIENAGGTHVRTAGGLRWYRLPTSEMAAT